MTNKKRHVKTDANTRKYIGHCISLIEFVQRFDLEGPIIVELDGYNVTVSKIKEIKLPQTRRRESGRKGD